ncbi:MAG: NUDIX domain-containing protein [Pseudomonadota bacterium]
MIRKVGAVILSGSSILGLRKRGDPTSTYLLPGGKLEPGESLEQALVRELREEIGAGVLAMSRFGEYEDRSALEDEPISMWVFKAEIDRAPVARAEIAEARWLDRDFAASGLRVGSILGRFVIPRLVQEGQM